MDHFRYRDGRLHCENLPVDDIVARVGTPTYIYSRHTFEYHYDAIARAFGELDPIICYSIKSCGNLHILRLLAQRGAGMDAVSGGELHRAQLAGVDPRKIVYAGVGKTDAEIQRGIELGIGWFNVESEQEFENIARIAEELGKTCRGALRVNPDVYDPNTHAKTTTGRKETKFGVDIERARRFFETYGRNRHCVLDAIHLHIGSPIYSPDPYVQAITRALQLIDDLRAAGYSINAIDIGGGYAADYESHRSPSYDTYASAIAPLLKGRNLRVILEPGRTIAANAGVLVTQVQYIKTGGTKKFVIADAGMQSLIRPAMYDAFHFIWPTRVRDEHVPPRRLMDMVETIPRGGLETVDIVGPICETGDILARGRAIPPVQRGDNLCIFTSGAYGMAMASNYNAMPRPAEVLVDESQATLIRRRETYEDLTAAETTTATI
jgi:diaminopimelate decarboxylase